MKSLVALSALVSLTIAAPALPGDDFEVTDRPQDGHIQALPSLPDVLKREKKSPLDIATSSILNTGVSNTEVPNGHHIDSGASTQMGRSFVLKKPLIVKKKYGYRLYRDSEEEKAHADSNEKCGRQVKVKLCDDDGKIRNTMKGSEHGMIDIHTSEDDVKHSIRMAKEAVENLQRDIKKMDQKGDMKKAHESESDVELHEDIEVARQALQHIHENFETLESMTLHATKTRDSEVMHDVHLTVAKTEEERMAQWKDAMDNIQKNFEIARNIEDSFKAASHQDSLLHLDQSGSAATISEHKLEGEINSHATLAELNHMHAAQNVDLETQHIVKEDGQDTLPNKASNEHLSEHNAKEEQSTEEDDMKTGASEMIEVHLDNIKSQEALRSESHKIQEHEKSAEGALQELNAHTEDKAFVKKENIDDHIHQEKSSDVHENILTDQSKHHITQLPSMKAVEEGIDTKLDLEKNAASRTSENIPDVHKGTHMDAHITTTNIVKPFSSDASKEQQRSVEQQETNDKIEHHLKEEKSAYDMTATDDMIDFLAKSAEHLDHDKMEKDNLHGEHVTELGKAAEIVKPVHKEQLTENRDMKPKEAVHSPLVEIKHEENSDQIPKSAEQTELNHFHNFAGQKENVMLAKSADHISLHDHQKQHMMEHEILPHVEIIPAMKAAEEHLHHLEHMQNAHWAHENRHLDHLSSMKAAEEFKNDFEMTHGHEHGFIPEQTIDHLRNSHLAEHSKMGASHDFELSSHVQPHTHQPSRYHHNSMTNGKLHELSGMGSAMHPNFHPSMRDAMEGFGSDHMLRWKPSHESARGAYGSGLSSSIGSPGAVGVFPNANTGGCAIPLLLSCSPSVVSGSLAKAHSAGPSSYGSSAYRTEDDFGFHNKRDIMKTNDMRTTNALRTPSIVKQKSPILLENKL